MQGKWLVEVSRKHFQDTLREKLAAIENPQQYFQSQKKEQRIETDPHDKDLSPIVNENDKLYKEIVFLTL